MSKELYVIHDKDIGFIDGGIGIIDKQWDAANHDDSTTSELIKRILSRKPKSKVIYLPYQEIPDPDTVKIVDGAFVELLPGEKTPSMIRKENKKLVDGQVRKMAIDKLKSESKLPANYSEQ